MTGQALQKKAPGERETGVRFRAEVGATANGGGVETAGEYLQVSGAGSVTLTIVAATDYREKDPARACDRDITAASRPFEALRKEHVAIISDSFAACSSNCPAMTQHACYPQTSG